MSIDPRFLIPKIAVSTTPLVLMILIAGIFYYTYQKNKRKIVSQKETYRKNSPKQADIDYMLESIERVVRLKNKLNSKE